MEKLANTLSKIKPSTSKNTGTSTSTSKNTSTGKNTGTSTLGRFVFMDFCQPAQFYLMLATLTLLYYVTTDQAIVWIALKAVIFISWSFILNKLCSMDLKAVAWLFAILPQIIFLFFTLKVSPAQPPIPTATKPRE
jgi:hypothetical protein